MENTMLNDIKEVLYSEAYIDSMVKRVGSEISRDYADKNLLLVSVLKGSVVFMADLMRAITIPARIDFMCVSSYGSGTKTSGVVKIIKDLDINLKGYDIVIVEDILDSGKTLHYLVNLLKSREPNSIEICTLFDKPERLRGGGSTQNTRAAIFPMRSSWATVSILMRSTETCRLSAF